MSNTTIAVNQSHRTQLRTDIEDFVSSYVPKQNLFFSNERDFQMHLACYLKDSKHYNQVYLEHNIPVSIFSQDEYKWNADGMVYVDIAVKTKDGKWVPIELKYKTTNAPGTCPTEMERFGTMLQGCVKNQSARNLGCYAFWKDVRRIELIKKQFEQVDFGFAVFLTNDKGYWNLPYKTGVAYEEFSLRDGITSKASKAWATPVAVATKYPDFTLDHAYPVNWNPKAGYYRCLIMEV